MSSSEEIGRIAGMEDILSAMRKNADFYKVLGSLLFNKPYEAISIEERKEAKDKFWLVFYTRRG